MARRVLVVDDEPDIIIVKKGLEKYGYEIDGFTDPVEVLTHFKPGYYDAILLDIRMPRMNGFELARKLYEIDTKPLYCFFTAFEIAIEEAKTVFPSLKVRAFFKKPVSFTEMGNTIGDLLAGK